MLNSTHIRRKIEGSPKFQALFKNPKGPQGVVSGLYLMILSRFPTEEELKAVSEYSKSGPAKGRDAVLDLAWALFNTTEFLYRH